MVYGIYYSQDYRPDMIMIIVSTCECYTDAWCIINVIFISIIIIISSSSSSSSICVVVIYIYIIYIIITCWPVCLKGPRPSLY